MKWSTASKFLLQLLVCTAHSAKSVPSDDVSVQVGYHVVFSYPGLQPPTHLFDLIKEGKVGGIILFGENVGSNLSTIVDQFQSTYKESPSYAGTPLLIMTDQEGGKSVACPADLIFGQSSDPQDAATQAGNDAASALQADHLNTNLAPVLDVYRQAGDFDDQYGRSFGNTSSLVSTCGTAFVSAQQSAGVIATAKHFPGLGTASTNQDTDEEPVTLNVTLNELRSVDEVPFTKAIAAGLDMVMHSWALYPALDSQYPSGLSQKWVQGELRGRLGFMGVTITDAIEAGALEAFGTDAERAVLASQAGMDMILASARNVTQGESVVDALVSALNDGTLSGDSFNEATDRILAVRKKVTA
ncbi:glycosyl hydrolase [Penicillium lagena]|uniref:glycosyl hydrolase n=1 Tax=Penicillium lagena TaxID=94218 RepID=UPI00254241BF|nr:glycosyl hydrolase [Penicillium lagena]KAJ5625453.1 glycosyl hydrolase [Penicillium lagena]